MTTQFEYQNQTIVYIAVQGLHHVLHKLNVLTMSSLYFVAKIVSTLSYLKLAENIIKKIVLQDELPIILTLEISHETQIKGHHV